MIFKMDIIRAINVMNVLEKFSFVSDELGHSIYQAKQSIIDAIMPFEEKRHEINAKYGEKDENGVYVVSDTIDNYMDYVNEMSGIINSEIQFEVNQIPRDTFNNTDIYNKDCLEIDYEILRTLFVAFDNSFGEVTEGENEEEVEEK